MDKASIIGLLIGIACLGYVFTEVSHGNFMMFSGLLAHLEADTKINLSRNAKAGLKAFKRLGDLSAHNRRFNAELDDESHTELADVIESCRKVILASKAAIAAGALLILAVVIGVIRFDPLSMIGALAALLL